MAKAKQTTMYYCQNCGHESVKWMGQCPMCKEWNTFVEETVTKGGSGMGGAIKSGAKDRKKAEPVALTDVSKIGRASCRERV